ncbi:MAG: class I SAM-dependent methyltransferase, partial [Solirubrobacteraceae bacterium]
TSILEVGCGDGWLLHRLRKLGFDDVLGIDPSRAASGQVEKYLVSGYFPQNIPASQQGRKFDLIISRHVLEHIETPRPFVAALAAALSSDGQLWLEVPDLESTLARELWSNFYQLHCNYFSAITLDQMVVSAGLRCVAGSTVEVFGGSLLRKYVHGNVPTLPVPPKLLGTGARVDVFRSRLAKLASQIPSGTVGYGAAERTAVTFGFAPALSKALTCLHDGNPLLTDRYLAGTTLPVHSKEALFKQPPTAVLIFAISNTVEILNEWRTRLPGDLLVGLVGGDFPLQPLKRFI